MMLLFLIIFVEDSFEIVLELLVFSGEVVDSLDVLGKLGEDL
jgi:hypothetical protein